jgi:hypothetical protein
MFYFLFKKKVVEPEKRKEKKMEWLSSQLASEPA